MPKVILDEAADRQHARFRRWQKAGYVQQDTGSRYEEDLLIDAWKACIEQAGEEDLGPMGQIAIDARWRQWARQGVR